MPFEKEQTLTSGKTTSATFQIILQTKKLHAVPHSRPHAQTSADFTKKGSALIYVDIDIGPRFGESNGKCKPCNPSASDDSKTMSERCALVKEVITHTIPTVNFLLVSFTGILAALD